MDEQLEYSELLNSMEWKRKREEILKRDNYKCQICNEPASIWISSSNRSGGSNIQIIENDPITSFPKTVKTLCKPKFLQIHHKLYILENNKLLDPWDYKNDFLLSVCNDCHMEIHRNEIIPIYHRKNNKLLETKEYSMCNKCGGEGYLPEYSHVQNGVCFKCNGLRIYKKIIFTL